jgi:hypothetical protein
LDVGPPGPSPRDAVSTKSSKDKRPKRSPGETLGEDGSAISARRRSRLAAEPRTYELDADERRRIMGGEEARGRCGVCGGRCVCPRARVVVGEVSHAPIRIPPWRAAMTVAFGDRAAQSGHRARLGRLMRFCELARGVVILPVSERTRRGRGAQVFDVVVDALGVVVFSAAMSRW